MGATARRIDQYAADDAELRAIVSELLRVDESYARLMSRIAGKLEHMASWSSMHHRNAMGAAMRIHDDPRED